MRWALVGFTIVAVLLAGMLGGVWLVSQSGCAILTLQRGDAPGAPTPPPGAPPALDEARVREEAPRVAALLDAALAEGQASEDHDDAARAMYAYLQENGAAGGVVSWRGETVHVMLGVC